MKQLLIICCAILFVGMCLVDMPKGPVAAVVTVIFALLVVLIINKYFEDSENKDFVISVFLIALVVRVIFGLLIHIFDLRSFTGPDALYYDRVSFGLSEVWVGNSEDPTQGYRSIATAWGLQYLIATLYSIIGRNILAAQSICAVIGAATAPLVYNCAKQFFENVRVAKYSAIGIALFPAFVIWSSQLLKDGLVLFFIVLSITAVLQLQKKISYVVLGLLIFSLGGVLSLRFYIFYMLIVAVVGSFVVGINEAKKQSVFLRLAVLAVLGLSLTSLGVVRLASVNFDKYVNFDRLQRSRNDLADNESGFGRETDVSTTSGAISAIPIGFTYLMFAPFPWEARNLRQAITIPDVLLWWCLIPFVVLGLWYSIRYKFRNVLPLLIFSIMLTLAYSMFQGNVGTAYRQRTQIQIFLFIFAGVGITYLKEKNENKKNVRISKQRQIEKALKEKLENNLN